jgi:hypothetical protein
MLLNQLLGSILPGVVPGIFAIFNAFYPTKKTSE